MPRILVVDDSPTVRRIIRNELAPHGFELVDAHDGPDAIIKLIEFDVDLVTLDIDMPGLDGFETCRRIRELEQRLGRARNVPVIFVTALDTVAGRDKGFESGAKDFIVKPFVEGELFGAVKRILYPAEVMKGVTVLVVDDSAVARQIIIESLKEQGFAFIEAESGEVGLDRIRRHAAKIDLVITDLMMPGIDGLALCRAIRQDLGLRDLPVIFLSAIPERQWILEMFKAGATDYLMKPFAKEELIARIGSHLMLREALKDLRQNVLQLKHLSKHKDEFLAIASHDLRSPLNSILGFSQLIMDSGVLPEKQKTFQQFVVSSGKHLLALIDDLLDLARLQAETEVIKHKPVVLPSVLQRIVDTLQPQATEKSIALRLVNRCDDNVQMMGDESALTRIFNNLLSNALKFTHSGGAVTVTLALESATSIGVSVADTGVGVSPENLARLFDKFSKASTAGTAGEKGTGLGMAITRELVERLNGAIHVASEVGKGTCFRVIFPLER